jgi:hypothetical protein
MALGPFHPGVLQGRKMLVQGDPFHLLPLLISSMNFSLFYHFLDAIALPAGQSCFPLVARNSTMKGRVKLSKQSRVVLMCCFSFPMFSMYADQSLLARTALASHAETNGLGCVGK